MALEVDAIYKDGMLHLLSPVPLKNGAKVRVRINTGRDEVREILAGLLVEIEEEDDEEPLPLLTTMDVDVQGGLTASEMIIQEREERGI